MGPGAKYAAARLGIFVACAVPALFLFPREMNPLLKLMIALVVSAAVSFYALRGLRDQVAQRMSTNAQKKIDERNRLRAALAGEDEPPPAEGER
jgi:hypothetical protein